MERGTSNSGAPLCILGLGNPGTRYAATRHNAGSWFVESLAKDHNLTFTRDKGHSLLVAMMGRVTLLRSTEFMNLSGEAATPFLRYHRIPPEALLVVHDELDLPPGVAKLKQGGGHAGHKGIVDLVRVLGSGNFWRLRIGIGHPRDKNLPIEVSDYVLGKPMAEERKLITGAIGRAQEVWPQMERGHWQEAVRDLHKSNPAPSS